MAEWDFSVWGMGLVVDLLEGAIGEVANHGKLVLKEDFSLAYSPYSPRLILSTKT